MTRTEYTNALRKAGFSVRPAWQASTDCSAARRDLTCYAVHAPDGAHVTDIVLRDLGADGLDVFFASRSLRAADDLAHLRWLAQEAA